MSVREPRRDETRSRILAAAVELFGMQGFDATTIRQISLRVGLTDAALYYHFKSKREILQGIWALPMGGGPTRIRPDGPLTTGRLRTILDATLDVAVHNSDFLHLIMSEVLAGDEIALALRGEGRSFLRRSLTEHFLTVTDAMDAEIRADAIVALVTGSTMRQRIEHGRAFAAALNDAVYRERLFRGALELSHLGQQRSA
ncbi:MAG: helix-turn-helix domain-containing protein [bacterium]